MEYFYMACKCFTIVSITAEGLNNLWISMGRPRIIKQGVINF